MDEEPTVSGVRPYFSLFVVHCSLFVAFASVLHFTRAERRGGIERAWKRGGEGVVGMYGWDEDEDEDNMRSEKRKVGTG